MYFHSWNVSLVCAKKGGGGMADRRKASRCPAVSAYLCESPCTTHWLVQIMLCIVWSSTEKNGDCIRHSLFDFYSHHYVDKDIFKTSCLANMIMLIFVL